MICYIYDERPSACSPEQKATPIIFLSDTLQSKLVPRHAKRYVQHNTNDQ